MCQLFPPLIMIKLIADSGSTKTDWWMSDETTQKQMRWQSHGLNPSLMDDAQLIEILMSEVRVKILDFCNDVRLLSSNCGDDVFVHQLFFYGSGCRPEQFERMRQLLSTTLTAREVHVASDLLGAAKALCGNAEGVVCILGTGSASALYNGADFVQSTPSLGYILGDEGSGTSLGKHLIADVMKQQLPEHICKAFEAEYHLGVAEIIQHVYREPNPNRYMAQFTHFLAKHISDSSVHTFVEKEFTLFFERNIVAYNRPSLQIHFIGSVAAVFAHQLQAAAERMQLQVGTIAKAPLDVEGAVARMGNLS